MAKTALKSLADIDGRTVAARQARGLAKQIETDLGGDLSAAQHELVTRVALLSAFPGGLRSPMARRRRCGRISMAVRRRPRASFACDVGPRTPRARCAHARRHLARRACRTDRRGCG